MTSKRTHHQGPPYHLPHLESTLVFIRHAHKFCSLLTLHVVLLNDLLILENHFIGRWGTGIAVDILHQSVRDSVKKGEFLQSIHRRSQPRARELHQEAEVGLPLDLRL